ncbi:hypothetical protein FRACA_20159 [Frankia canadensis]|uniref:Uncharacterized protein n=1 Tax=Frankia canadensis TaxID=1836972 RepID=A0A2I2KQ16_9ACTN|nr:hypothetical protein FRACA_20159 [Frankia canadensis]SOU55053.1 hypothetical protein FRACA_20159 [Frankia canadensis]
MRWRRNCSQCWAVNWHSVNRLLRKGSPPAETTSSIEHFQCYFT